MIIPDMITPDVLDRLSAIVGPEHVVVDASARRHGSRDFYWFSPVLKPQLDHLAADVIVRPGSVDELIQVISLAVRERIPLTPRGAGCSTNFRRRWRTFPGLRLLTM